MTEEDTKIDDEEEVEEFIEENLDEDKEVVPYVGNEPPEVKAEARSQGWTDLKEWAAAGKPTEDWRPSSVFLDNGKLYKQYASLKEKTSHEVGEVKSQLKILGEHNRKMAVVERNKALRELKAEKLEALENQDHAKVMAVDEEIANVKSIPIPEVHVDDPAVDPLEDVKFPDWHENNKWYDDPELREQADVFGILFRQKNPQAMSSEVFGHVAEEIKRLHPDKFNKDVKASKVGSTERTTGDTGTTKTRLPALKTMPFEFQKVARSMESNGIMTANEYMQQTVDIASSEGKTLDEYIKSLNLV